MAHEPENDESAAFDAYNGAFDGEVDVFLYESIERGTPNTWFRETEAWLVDEFGVAPTVTTELTLADGSSVRVFELQYSHEGDEYFFQEADVFPGNRAWEVDWYSTPGTEDADRATLLGFVGTFEPIVD